MDYKHIEFKKKYKNLLKSGKKKCTVRKRCYVKEGDEVFVHCGGKIIGKAKILKVEGKKLNELDEDVAKAEGFSTKEELLNEIKKLYGNLDKVYVIRFEFEPFKKPVSPEEMYYGSENLKDIAKRALRELKLSDEERKILEMFVECGSVKKTALKLGGIWERKRVRELLRKCYKQLT